METKQHDVFLSHNSTDKATVRQVGEILRQRGLRVWLDEWELIPARPWIDALEDIIKSAKTAAILVGNDGLGPWEIPEMRGCLSEFVDRGMPVIPVLLPGVSSKPELPLFLRQFTWVDMSSGLTSQAVDRLQWGITGVNPTTYRHPQKLRNTEDGQESRAGEITADVFSPVDHDGDGYGVAVETGLSAIELHIIGDFDSFDTERQSRVLDAIRRLIGVGEVRVISKKPGSIRLTIGLPKDAAAQLLEEIKSGALRDDGIIDANIVEHSLLPETQGTTSVLPEPIASSHEARRETLKSEGMHDTTELTTFPHTVILFYPAPIAIPYKRFISRPFDFAQYAAATQEPLDYWRAIPDQEPRTQLDLLIFVVESMVRYLATLGVIDLLHCLARHDAADRQFLDMDPAFEFLRSNRRMTLGAWVSALKRISDELKHFDDRFVAELPSVCGADGVIGDFFSDVVSNRNWASHAAGILPLSREECRDVVHELLPKVNHALHAIQFVLRYPLAFVESAHQQGFAYDLFSCMGTAIDDTRRAIALDTNISLRTQVPFICDPTATRLLYLWPLMLERFSQTTHRHMVYGFDRIPDKGRRYLAEARWSAIDGRNDHWQQTLHTGESANHQWLLDKLTADYPIATVGDAPEFQRLIGSRVGENVGQMLGDYRIVRFIGRGGCGSVYAAETPDGHFVAVKVLERADGFQVSPRDVAGFFDEYDRVAEAGTHASIVRVYERGVNVVDDKRVPWYAMELATADLRSVMEERGEELPWSDPDVRTATFYEFCTILEGVCFLHNALNLVHRDLKPENILVVNDGSFRLADFGIVKNLRQAKIDVDLLDEIAPGSVVGTPRYMSPEQAGGSEVSKSSDVYSLGIILAEVLTGAMPEPRYSSPVSNSSTINEVLRECEKRGRLHKSVIRFIRKSTIANPTRRFRDACEMLEAFQGLRAEFLEPD